MQQHTLVIPWDSVSVCMFLYVCVCVSVKQGDSRRSLTHCNIMHWTRLKHKTLQRAARQYTSTHTCDIHRAAVDDQARPYGWCVCVRVVCVCKTGRQATVNRDDMSYTVGDMCVFVCVCVCCVNAKQGGRQKWISIIWVTLKVIRVCLCVCECVVCCVYAKQGGKRQWISRIWVQRASLNPIHCNSLQLIAIHFETGRQATVNLDNMSAEGLTAYIRCVLQWVAVYGSVLWVQRALLCTSGCVLQWGAVCCSVFMSERGLAADIGCVV